MLFDQKTVRRFLADAQKVPVPGEKPVPAVAVRRHKNHKRAALRFGAAFAGVVLLTVGVFPVLQNRIFPVKEDPYAFTLKVSAAGKKAGGTNYGWHFIMLDNSRTGISQIYNLGKTGAYKKEVDYAGKHKSIRYVVMNAPSFSFSGKYIKSVTFRSSLKTRQYSGPFSYSDAKLYSANRAMQKINMEGFLHIRLPDSIAGKSLKEQYREAKKTFADLWNHTHKLDYYKQHYLGIVMPDLDRLGVQISKNGKGQWVATIGYVTHIDECFYGNRFTLRPGQAFKNMVNWNSPVDEVSSLSACAKIPHDELTIQVTYKDNTVKTHKLDLFYDKNGKLNYKVLQ